MNEFIHVHKKDLYPIGLPYIKSHRTCLVTELNTRAKDLKDEWRQEIGSALDVLSKELQTIPWYRDIIELSKQAIRRKEELKLKALETTEYSTHKETIQDNDIVEDTRYKPMYINAPSVVRVNYSYYDHPHREDFSTCSPVKCIG
jgi:hypothetical protein